jgi:hypothetical protein
MKYLGVEINLSKSILSRSSKGLEFAKKTMIRFNGSLVDCSPFPLQMVSALLIDLSSLISFMKLHKLDLLTLVKFLGFGHRVQSGLKTKPFKLQPSAIRKIIIGSIVRGELSTLDLSRGFDIIPSDLERLIPSFVKEEVYPLQAKVQRLINSATDALD